MNDAVVMAEHTAIEVDDFARTGSARPQPLDDVGIMSGRHEADVLAVLLVGNRQAKTPCQITRLRFSAVTERKAQQIELRSRRGEQEIALIAFCFTRAIQRAAATRQRPRRNVVARRQNLGSELARGLQQVAEFDRLVAFDARHRRLAGDVTLGETVDHRFLEATFVIENVVRNTDARGDRAGIMNIAAGATGAFAVGRRAVVVELERDADDVIAGVCQKRRGHRGIDPPRHRDDDARVGRPSSDIETAQHDSLAALHGPVLTISGALSLRHGP